MMHKILFVLYPDTAVAAEIARHALLLRRGLGLTGKMIPAKRLHVTLCHIGTYVNEPCDIVAKASDAAATIAAEPFMVGFDLALSFRRNVAERPFVLCGSDGMNDLMSFQKGLVAAMTKVRIGKRAQSGFTPHVTMMYADQDVEEQTVKPMRWTVGDFVLVDSLQGKGLHRQLGRWPLRG